jgi:hypothetical protein
MSRIQYIKKIRPDELSLERIREAAERRIRDWPHWLAWKCPAGRARENRLSLERLRGIHGNERCFIIANGPSLRRTDLDPLRDEFTIGMNRIYLMSGFVPDYLVVTDIEVQLEQFHEELERVKTVKLFNWNARRLFGASDGILYLKPTFRPRFSTELPDGIWGGHSVTYACLQVAYFLGFQTVILVGKDHSYREEGVPGKLITSSGEENNHFARGYYRKGMVWRIPDYKGEELGYRMARRAFEADGRRVLDATIGGKLDVFEKVDYHALFGLKQAPAAGEPA